LSNPKILIVDDEPQIRRFLGISLRAGGYEVVEAGTGADGLGSIAASEPNLIILDLGLPDMDGTEVLSQLREFCTTPVLVLTVRSDESEKVKLLDLGADDYLTKPFGLQELLARIRVLLRTRGPTDEGIPSIYDDGHLRIDRQARLVTVASQEVSLTKKEFQLLSILLENGGKIVTQPQLLKLVWGVSHTEDTHYLRIAISKLRAKLGDNAINPIYLHTENGVGFRFKPRG